MDNNNDNNPQTLTDEQLEQLSEDQLLDIYCEQLMVDKGLDDVKGKARDDVRSELKEKLNFEINRAILAALPDDKFNEIDEQAQKGDDIDMDAISRVIDESGIDVDHITEETMTKFRELYLNDDQPEA